MHACKCQLFTDEDSHTLLKHLNCCFSVLASATDQKVLGGGVTVPYTAPHPIHTLGVSLNMISWAIYTRNL